MDGGRHYSSRARFALLYLQVSHRAIRLCLVPDGDAVLGSYGDHIASGRVISSSVIIGSICTPTQGWIKLAQPLTGQKLLSIQTWLTVLHVAVSLGWCRKAGPVSAI